MEKKLTEAEFAKPKSRLSLQIRIFAVARTFESCLQEHMNLTSSPYTIGSPSLDTLAKISNFQLVTMFSSTHHPSTHDGT